MADVVLVTGGSGYIAGFTIRQLIEQGWTVRATIRTLKREAEVRDWLQVDNDRLSFFAADLTNDAGWAEAMAGCSHVVHMASPIPAHHVKDENELIVPARDGALRALRFARDAGVTRLVMTSSVAAIFYGRAAGKDSFTEADWTNVEADDVSAYAKSKTIAERAARAWIAAEGGSLEFVTVNPGLVLGPLLGTDFSPSLEAVKRVLEGAYPALPDLGFNLVDVRDVADLHIRALTAPDLSGERFMAVAPHGFLRLAEIAAVLRERLPEHAGKVPTRRMPDWIMRIVSLFDPVVRQMIGELGKTRHAEPTHAIQVLGWQPRSAEDSVVDTARSLIDLGVSKV
jgi:nucleoside-diphosphate-sugar epimerase